MLFASYRSPKTDIRPSAIGGRGLFAVAPIRRGEVVSVKGGHLLDRAGMAELGGTVGDADLQVTDDLFLAPVSEAEFDAVMMFLNHSCEPNVGVQGQIVFVAMRDVAASEELTIDYATIDHDTPAMTCRCGAAACRGVLTGRDWQRPELQQKYGRYFAWYLLEKMHAEHIYGSPCQ
jgi:SET domain-containing protein